MTTSLPIFGHGALLDYDNQVVAVSILEYVVP
jgi:hypothetical protein